jgi:DNA-binding response OmpR family regulator
MAITDPDPANVSTLAFAAERRGHQTVMLGAPGDLFRHLPFEPTTIVFSVSDTVEGATGTVRKLKALFPDAVLIATLERPREPLPSVLLRAGVNEVIRTPYNPHELILKAEQLQKGRSASDSLPDDSLRLADIEIALDRYTASKNGQRLNFTKLELRLLYCLCEHHPHLTPTERLLTFGWDTLGDPDAALIKTHISHIRKKLKAAGGTDVAIVSRQTLGYVLSVAL